ncbi:hypothetical protein GPROT1_03884 [Gammaproteobacteria bacterium]|nr:hypothetical protein GPROT1_03884 [Gammaproteobacteria bacterium]
MNATSDLRLRLHANWMQRPRTLGEFVDERIEYLKRLQGIHPLFREGLHLLGDSRQTSPALAPDLSNVEAFVLKETAALCRTSDARWFTGMTADGRATLETSSQLGFLLSVTNLRRHDKDDLLVRLDGGSSNPEQGASAAMDLPFAGVPEFSDPAFLKELLRVVVDYWKPEQAGIYNRVLHRATRDRETYSTPVSWLTYLDDRQVETVLPPDIHREPFGQGILFSLQPNPPLDNVEDAIEKAIRVRDALLPGQWMTKRYWRGKSPLRPPVAA